MMPYWIKFSKKAKIKIKFQKMKGTFLDSILWVKSHHVHVYGSKPERKILIKASPKTSKAGRA